MTATAGSPCPPGPERTHSVTGHEISDEWTLEQGLAALRAMLGLVRRAAPNERMYLLIEF